MIDSNSEKKRRIYVLQRGHDKEIMSIWSNLSKLYKALEARKANIQVYGTIARKIQEDGVYKFEEDDIIYKILVKHLE